MRFAASAASAALGLSLLLQGHAPQASRAGAGPGRSPRACGALGRRPERRPAVAARARGRSGGSNRYSMHRYPVGVPIYVLRYAAVDRKQVERMVDPYLFRPSEVQRREVAGEFEL